MIVSKYINKHSNKLTSIGPYKNYWIFSVKNRNCALINLLSHCFILSSPYSVYNKNTSKRFLDAANAYKNIVNAIKDAMAAAKKASDDSANAQRKV